MGIATNIWRKVTHTKALDQSSGELETLFFESVYRVSYIMGLSTADRSILYLLYSNAVKIAIFLLVIGEIWYGLTLAESLDELADAINVVGIHLIATYRYLNMMNHKGFYKKLSLSMQSPFFDISTAERQRLVKFWAERNERFLKLLLSLGNSALAAWYIYPLVDELEYNLLTGIRIPFDYRTPIRYPFTYIVTATVFMYISHFVMVTDLTMQVHLIHLLCQFNVLSDCFENLIDDCSVGFEDIPRNNLVNDRNFAEIYTKRLGNLVEQHKLILSHTMSLRNSLSGPMLAQLAASTTLICFIGYQATISTTLVKSLMSCLFLGYNMFELYVICRWCEEITVQSFKVGEAIYCSGWECGVSKLKGVRSTITFVIARASRPLVLTAGGMYSLSLTSYTTLVKTSYSALTILLRFRHD